MIHGVKNTALKQIEDFRGKVMHVMKSTDPHFEKFGEVYFSWIYPKAVKAWSKHLRMTMNYAVPVGSIKLVLFDDREESPTQGKVAEFILGSKNYALLTIPPGLWYGFKSLGSESALIVNCATIPHDPSEMCRLDVNDLSIPYVWDK
jgi:dTDP-4-dehydrorhamnose 3,5-epimerase